MKKNSIWGIISFIWLLCGLILLIFFEIGRYSEKYVFHNSFSFSDHSGTVLTAGIIISFTGCFITGIIASFKKNSKKILPIISLSVILSITYLTMLFVLTPLIFSKNVAYGVVTNYGIFEIPIIKLSDKTERTLYEQRVLKNNTDEIPAVMGTRFGFNYVIAGEPDDEEILIKRVIRYPAPGLITAKETKLADTISFYVNLNKLKYFGYMFEHDYELIPGLWEIEFFFNGKRLLMQKFRVKKESKSYHI